MPILRRSFGLHKSASPVDLRSPCNRRMPSRSAQLPGIFVRVLFIGLLLLLLLPHLDWRLYLSHPRGCNVVQVWSHRGHLDSSDLNSLTWTCDHVLEELHANGIRHYDIDVINIGGQSIVAHPTEMSDNIRTFSPSPCSKLPLKEFIQKLKRVYQTSDFFITIEPKAAWMGNGDFLEPPEDVVSAMLVDLELEPIPNRHCGIILQGWQLRDNRIAPLLHHITQLCQISLPLKQSDAPLRPESIPWESVEMVMPWIGLFGNADGNRFLLSCETMGVAVTLWIVDTFSELREALHMKGVQGVISNNPVRLKRMYEEICR